MMDIIYRRVRIPPSFAGCSKDGARCAGVTARFSTPCGDGDCVGGFSACLQTPQGARAEEMGQRNPCQVVLLSQVLGASGVRWASMGVSGTLELLSSDCRLCSSPYSGLGLQALSISL